MSYSKQIKKQEKELSELFGNSYESGGDIAEQRSLNWFKKRIGKFTGSGIKELMKCDKSGAKIPWGEPEKVTDLGEPAINYIYSKAMERKVGFAIKTGQSTDMKYGAKVENAIIDKYLKNNKHLEFKEQGFIEIEKYLGVSPDGLFIEKNKNKRFAVEIKAPSSWGGLYKRTEILIDEKHIDFWQFQTEMMGLKADKLISLVAMPVADNWLVVNDIEEINITELFVNEVKASPIHQKAIRQRALLGDKIIKTFLSDSKMKFIEAVRKECSDFEL